MKKRSRFLVILLTLAMTFSMLPAGAVAADPDPLPKVEETVPAETPAVTETPKTETPAVTETPKTETPAVTETPTVTETPAAPVSPQSAGARAVGADDVAKIGNDGYATFAAALVAANANADASTITLLKDCTYVGDTISHPLTIDGAGKTLTMNNGNDYAFFNVLSSGDTAINNLKIMSTVPDGKADVFHVKSKLTMTGCTVTTKNKPENGMFHTTGDNFLTLVSGTYTTPAGGKITSGASIEMKTGDTAATIVGGSICLSKGKFIKLSATSAAPTKSFNIRIDATAAADDKLVDGAAASSILVALAAKIIVNGGTDWNCAPDGNNIALKRLPIRYVLAKAASGDGTLAKPFATLQAAYDDLANGGEIRVLSHLDSEAAGATFGTDQNYTIRSYNRTGKGTPGDPYAAVSGTVYGPEGCWSLYRTEASKEASLLTINAGTVNLTAFTLDGNKSSDQAIAGVSKPLVSVGASATLNLNLAATLQNNTTSGDGGAISTAGTVNMHNGAKISGNKANNYGSAVIVTGTDVNAKFVMTGGEISGNTTTAAGGSGTIMIATDSTGDVEIKGTALIKDNAVLANGSAIHGGAGGSTIKIGGTASITGNKRTGTAPNFKGCAIFPFNGTVTLDDAPTITGNTDSTGAETNVLLCMDSNAAKPFVIGTLTGGSIGVTGASGTPDVATDALAADVKYVHSDSVEFFVMLDGNKLVLKASTDNAYVSSTGNDSSGTGATDAPYKTLATAYLAVKNNGTIHVMDGLAPMTATTNFDADKKITITSCLAVDPWTDGAAAHTIKRAVGFTASMLDITAGDVTMKHLVLDGVGKLMDSVPGHGVDTEIEAAAPLVEVHSKTKAPTLTLSEGAVLQNNYTPLMGCAGIKVGSVGDQYGNLNIQPGAKIQYNRTGATADDGSSSGSALYVRGTHTQFTMTGGEISHNTGDAYATVNFCGNNKGTAVISGGSITANTCTKAEGTGGILVDTNGVLTINGGSITGNKGEYGGVAFWDGSGALNMGGSAAINITGNKANDNAARNVYLNGTKINLISHLTTGSTIGVYSTATPSPAVPVLVATGANAADATYFTSDNLTGAGIRAAKPGDADHTGIYLDVAEKMKAQIIKTDTSKVLYKTFDDAMAAIKADSGNLLVNSVSNDYKIELLADCTTNGAFPAKTIAMQSISGQHYALMVNNFITTTGGNFTATDIKFADATSQHEWLQAKSPWSFTGCELPNFAVVGVTVTLNTGTEVNGNIRIDSNPLGNLAIKAGNVPVNGSISIHNDDSVITLLADSTAAMRYKVVYGSEVTNLAPTTKVVFNGAGAVGVATDLAKKVTINDSSVWTTSANVNNVVLKEVKAYHVNAGYDNTGNTSDGSFTKPYTTLQLAYDAAVTANDTPGIQIRVLSDLADAALDMNDAKILSAVVESYSATTENVKATAPWKLKKNDTILKVSKGNAVLQNIQLSATDPTTNTDKHIIEVSSADASLTLNAGAKICDFTNINNVNVWGTIGVLNSSMTMNDGAEISNLVTNMGNIRLENSTFTMNGGLISGLKAGTAGTHEGTAAYVAGNSKFVMNGGKITGCGSRSNTLYANGTIYLHQAAANQLIMTGGEISGNTATLGGGVYMAGAGNVITISGDAKISGNSKSSGEASNVYLITGQTITIGGAHMGAGSAVGVYCQNMPDAAGETVAFATNAVEADKGHFFSDKVSTAGIKFLGDKVLLAYDARYIPEPIYPGGPEPTRPDPNVTVEPGPGKVTVSPKNPNPGTKVTVTIEPETGWEIDKVIIVTVPGGEPVVVTGTNPITYIAPDPNTVKITVKYKRTPVDPQKTGVSKLLETDKHIAYMVGVPGGKFNPTSGITRAETAQMFYNLLREQNAVDNGKFSDVDAATWYAKAVNALAELKIIEGRGADVFDPASNISRAEFTAIAMRFAIATKGEVTFTDVSADHWAQNAIAGAAQYGWIMGYEDGSFKPQGDITRSEAAKVVNTMLGRFPDEKFIDGATDLKTFSDVEKTDWAFYEIAEATNAHDFTKVKNVETWKK